MIYGHDDAVDEFVSAWRSRKMHHAWLLTGPKGVGKATFAWQAQDASWPKRLARFPMVTGSTFHMIIELRIC